MINVGGHRVWRSERQPKPTHLTPRTCVWPFYQFSVGVGVKY
jgi:hypothetical protein